MVTQHTKKYVMEVGCDSFKGFSFVIGQLMIHRLFKLAVSEATFSPPFSGLAPPAGGLVGHPHPLVATNRKRLPPICLLHFLVKRKCVYEVLPGRAGTLKVRQLIKCLFVFFYLLHKSKENLNREHLFSPFIATFVLLCCSPLKLSPKTCRATRPAVDLGPSTLWF